MSKGGATGFEDLTWGMTLAEVRAKIGESTVRNETALDQRREINGVECEVSFLFRDNGGLDHISVCPFGRYREWGDGDSDHAALIEWVRSMLGEYTERESASATWILPTAKVWTFMDEALGLYFDKPD